MNRPLKFRVWDKVKKSFADTKNICWGNYYKQTGQAASGNSGELLMDFDGDLRIATYPCGNGDNSADSVFVTISNNDDFILQQFTGLLDLKGKEIYEGDLLKITMGGDFQDELYIVEDTCKFYFDCNRDDSYLQITSYKIVGNIFENPDLIKSL